MNLIKHKTPLFDLLLSDIFNENETVAKSFETVYSPLGDILETDEEYLIELMLPGFTKSDVKIDLKENVLTVSGERKKSDVKYNRQESYYGKIKKQYTLPNHVNVEDIKAKFENGVLKLTVPKDVKKLQANSIEIE